MATIEDTFKKFWNNERVRDITIISGVTLLEQVTESILLRQVAPKYHTVTRAIINGGSNTMSYYLGKSMEEKYGKMGNQNANP